MSRQVLRLLVRGGTMAPRRDLTARALIYKENGDPAKVVGLEAVEVADQLGSKEVRVKWLAAPVNPADVNQIQGVYPVKPPLPAVGGNEGYGVVEKIGSDVSRLKVGDHVQSAKGGLGTWREYGNHDESHVFPIDVKGLSAEAAATIQVNPPTAYRMLKDFVDLKPGDVVIQNGANSAVGRAAIEIARARGLQTVNIVRDRPDLSALVSELKSLGADHVLTEEELVKQRRNFKDIKLALNCVGGKSALLLAATLGKQGVMVTYGGMSKQPLQVPTAPLIFNDIRLYGFWMTRWYGEQKDEKERSAMFKELAELYRTGKLHPPNIKKTSIENYKEALTEATTKYDKKQLFVFN